MELTASFLSDINIQKDISLAFETADILHFLNQLGELPNRAAEIAQRGGLPGEWYPVMLALKHDRICQQALLDIATAASQFEEECTKDLGKHLVTRAGAGTVYTPKQIDAISELTWNLYINHDNPSYTVPQELTTFLAQKPLQSTVVDIASFVNELINFKNVNL